MPAINCRPVQRLVAERPPDERHRFQPPSPQGTAPPPGGSAHGANYGSYPAAAATPLGANNGSYPAAAEATPLGGLQTAAWDGRYVPRVGGGCTTQMTAAAIPRHAERRQPRGSPRSSGDESTSEATLERLERLLRANAFE